MHAVSQGALAVEIRADDAEAAALVGALSHWPTEFACRAERACLRVLEGGCSVPVGVHSAIVQDEGGKEGGRLTLTGCVTALDGQAHVEYTLEAEVRTAEDAEVVGERLARVLIDTGARAILDDITKDRERRVGELKATEEIEKIEASLDPAPSQA